MGTVTELIPADVLRDFLRQHMKTKLVVVSISGPHAYGYPTGASPLQLQGIHVEPTEKIVGLTAPPQSYNWVEEFEGWRIDYSSVELGEAFTRLMRGDGSILERIMAPRQLIKGMDLRRLQKVTRGVICRRFFNHYRNFAKGVAGDCDEIGARSVRQVLGVYRMALTGAHLFETGEVVLSLVELAREYRMARIEALIERYREQDDAVLSGSDPWINRIVKLHSLLEQAVEKSRLPADPDNPGAVEEYLLDMRRRFFDAPTIQEDG